MQVLIINILGVYTLGNKGESTDMNKGTVGTKHPQGLCPIWRRSIIHLLLFRGSFHSYFTVKHNRNLASSLLFYEQNP